MANSELQVAYQGDSATIYAIVRRVSDQKVWDVANTTWATWADGSIGDYDTVLASADGDFYTGTFPEDISSGTDVRILYYEQAGGSPATSDLLLATRRATWNGVTADSGSVVALDSTALSTLNGVKRQLRITGSTYDTILTELINSVSAMVKRVTGRDIVATNYREWYSGNHSDALVLNNWPLIYVNRVAFGRDNAIDVTYSGSAIRASVQVHTSGVRLVSQVAAGTVTTTEVDFATYPTASTIATQISAQSGWTATLRQDTDAYYLNRTGGQDAKSRTVFLTYADDSEEDWDADYTRGRLTWRRDCGYARDQYGFGGLGRSNPTPIGRENILVDYRAGYETVPADVDQVVRELVQAAFNKGLLNGNLQSESIGDYSYTLADQVQVTESQWAILRPYSREAVA